MQVVIVYDVKQTGRRLAYLMLCYVYGRRKEQGRKKSVMDE